MKELCKARAKLEMSSNLGDEPTLADVLHCSKLLDEKVTFKHFHTINENPFETVIWQESDRWCPPPTQNCQWKRSNSAHIHTINENPFETVIWGESDRWCPPPIWNCQSTEWSLCCSMWSMRAHLKQSTYKKI